MNSESVVILGAGPAGLAAGHELTRHGIRPVMLEKADKVGGISRTEVYKGYNFDIGGHRFFTKMEPINRLWQDMLGEDLLKVHRISRICYRGRFFKYPFSFFDALSNLGVSESLLILLSYFKTRLSPFPEEKTFDQWVTNRFGARLYETFFRAYTEKVWGIPCHEIQADWAAQRIRGLSLAGAVSNALFGVKKAKTLIDEFYYPSRGPGMMWERFREVFNTAGGRLMLNSEAVGLMCEGGRIVGARCSNGGGIEEISLQHVISSIPITKLVAMLDPKAPEEALEASHKLKYRSLIVVGLIVDRQKLFPDQWIYVHNPKVKVGRIQNFKNWSAAMVPNPRRTSVGMEYFCNEGDDTWTMSDAGLVEIASKELSELGLAEVDDVIDWVVFRQPGAYPIYDREYEENLRVIRSFLATIDNLQTIGRNGMHRYNNMDHSMLTGILAAQNVLGKKHDLWEVNEEDAYLEVG